MEAIAIVVFIAAVAFLVFCMGGFNDLIERRYVAKNQSWRRERGDTE